MIGQRLAHFTITAKLGAGGMGEVYRARDERLGRDVALKILPPGLVASEERLARFAREARLLASLNHPNIAGIYEVGTAAAVGDGSEDPLHYLALELVQGETLAGVVARGPVPVERAVSLARQIAEALEAAHARGVIHRDLKPGNVMVAPDGRVKVLDFGLAKALEEPTDSVADLAHSPTLTARMTGAGVILGTAAYMSPEQAKGEEVDRRSDIWSFGVVLWEMLTGRQLFDEVTASETLAAILKVELDLGSLPRDLPRPLLRLLGRCLQKDLHQRLHDIADARLELEAVAAGEIEEPVAAREGAGKGAPGAWRLATVVATLVALLALTGWYVNRKVEPTSPSPTIRFRVNDPPAAFDSPSLALSPDGTKLVYQALGQDGVRRLYVRSIGEVEPQPIPGTENGNRPFFSPDGTRLGFVAGATLKIVTLGGGTPLAITDVGGYRGATWTDADSILLSPDTESGLWRIAEDGRLLEKVTAPDAAQGERSHRDPVLLPGGKAVLFTVATSEITTFDDARIDAIDLATRERRNVVARGMFPLFLSPDHLLFFSSGKLLVAPFDPDTLTLGGAPTAVLEGIRTLPRVGLASAAVSPDGSLAIGLGSSEPPHRRLSRFTTDGEKRPLSPEERPYQSLDVSPDGRTIALDVDAANAGVWLLDVERGIQTRLTLAWSHSWPLWSPDGSEILTTTSRGGTFYIYRHPIAGGEPQPVHQFESISFATDWTADGTIVFFSAKEGEPPDIWRLGLDEPSRVTPLVEAPGAQFDGRISPDGLWLAYVSDESGRMEVYLLQLSGAGAKIRVSADGGYDPVWHPTGNQLHFVSTAGLMVATVDSATGRVGRASRLFEVDMLPTFSGHKYDLLPDGSFVVIEEPTAKPPPLEVIWTRNWIAELEARIGRRGAG